jgi:hypothetical protein
VCQQHAAVLRSALLAYNSKERQTRERAGLWKIYSRATQKMKVEFILLPAEWRAGAKGKRAKKTCTAKQNNIYPSRSEFASTECSANTQTRAERSSHSFTLSRLDAAPGICTHLAYSRMARSVFACTNSVLHIGLFAHSSENYR